MSGFNKIKHLDNREVLSYRLFLSLTEQFKNSLVQISKTAESTMISGIDNVALIKSTSDYMIELIKAYNFSVQLSIRGSELDIEPVSITSILYKTAENLKKIASNYGVDVNLNFSGKHNLILSNSAGLEASLVSLGIALIEALPSYRDNQLSIHLATHRCRYGIVAGIYMEDEYLSFDTLKKGRNLYGKVRQPLTNLSHTASAGVFIADNILNSMNLRLKASHHKNLYGLGVVLNPISQLELIN